MSSRPELRIDWCTHEAAKYAVEKWHYSRCMPKSKLAKFGVWESGTFIGSVIFGVSANRFLSSPYGLAPTEVCELVRVALTKHDNSVSRILAITLKMLRKEFGNLRLVVSFADPLCNHHGGIYQAGNWLYTGRCSPSTEVFHKRKWIKRVDSTRGHTGEKRIVPGKHRYLMPLDEAMRKQIEPLRKPYPKRVRSDTGDTPANHAGEEGSAPIRTLSDSPTPSDLEPPCQRN